MSNIASIYVRATNKRKQGNRSTLFRMDLIEQFYIATIGLHISEPAKKVSSYA